MSIGKAFLFANAALILGVASASFAMGTTAIIYIIAAGLVGGVFLIVKRRLSLFIALAVFSGFFIGYARFTQDIQQAQALHQRFVVQTNVAFAGDVIFSEKVGKQTHAILEVPKQGKIAVYTYDEAVLGSNLQVSCKTIDPDFSLSRYASTGIHSQCQNASVIATQASTHLFVRMLVYAENGRHTLSRIIVRAIPSPEAEFLQGVVLGEKKNLPDDLQTAFQKTGTTHIVVLSGYNISILAAIIISFLRKLGLGVRKSTWLVLALTAGFVVLTGFSSPSIRALVMCTAVLLARSFGRKSTTVSALCFSAAVMICVQPTLLGWSMSFQLSFLATVGVIASDRLHPLVLWLPEQLGIRDNVATTVSATIMTMPIIAYGIGTVSFVSVLVNAIVLSLVPLAMACGAVIIVCGLINQTLAIFIGAFGFCVARVMLMCIIWFSDLPFSAAHITHFWWGIMCMWYAVAVSVYWKLRKQNSTRSQEQASQFGFVSVSIAGAVCLTTMYLLLFPSQPKMRLSFFDVGQGDAEYIRTASGYDVLIDGGPDTKVASGLGQDISYFDRTIDVVVLTHPHMDHITGLLDVLDRYHVKQVIVGNDTKNTELEKQFFNIATSRHIPITVAKAGDSWSAEDTTLQFQVLAPKNVSQISDVNDTSVVIRLTSPFVTALYTGDAGMAIEKQIMEQNSNIQSEILKVGHHGSTHSSSDEFLAAIHPQFGIISSGKGNPYGHPNQLTLDRLASHAITAVRTDTCGTITFSFGSAKPKIQTASSEDCFSTAH